MKPLAVAALIGLCAPCVLADSLPPQTVAKPGKATPSAVTVQGVSGGTPIPISGTISASSSLTSTAAAPTYIEGSTNAFSSDLGGALRVLCTGGSCGGASPFADAGAFTGGTTSVSIAAGVFDDTLTALTAGKAAAPRMTSKRALHFNLRDNSGNEIPFPAALAASGGMKVDVQNASLPVTGTFWQTTQPVSGTFWQTTQPVSGTFWQTTQPVSGTVTANISGSISNTTFGATQGTSPWVTADNHTTAAAPLSLRLSDGAAFYDARSIRALTVADVVGLGAGSAIVGKVGIDQTTPGTTNLVAAGQNGTWTVQPGNTANTTPWLVAGNQTPATAFANPTNAVNANGLLSGWNGATWDRLSSAGNNNDAEAVTTTGVLDVEAHGMVFNGTSWDRQRGGTQGTVVENAATTTAASALSQKTYTANTALSVKASAGNVYGWSAINAAATVCWLQFYNTAGTPTCGTAVVWSVPLPVTPGVSNTVSPIPYANFATGIAICVSTTSTGGVTCGSTSSGTIFYK